MPFVRQVLRLKSYLDGTVRPLPISKMLVSMLNCGSETHAEEFKGVADANSPQKGPVSARSANAKIEK